MSIWGKLLGGTAGFAVGGPLGALAGGLAGHAVDHMRVNTQRLVDTDDATTHDADTDNTRKIAFTIAVIVLSAKLAKADGRVSRDEISAFREVFHVPEEERENVGKVFNQARRDARGYEPYAKQMARLFRDSPEVLEELLHCLFHIARADGTIHHAELTFLQDLARIFGLDGDAWERVCAANMPDEQAGNPYAVLGVDPGMSNDDIKAAYRKLVRENHPDRLIARGVPQEMVDRASTKLAAINEAYEQIREQRGIR